ncbi:unnamed protein product [Cyclocybe aegerita]|uniref:Uncharacterized protein n=1 Tax=Cyclocybe aegerita TaxID=1973307 RepID=A0A8S0WGR7_CYCAE|nr:unnamed protein product [Cyclocybe aegerita]
MFWSFTLPTLLTTFLLLLVDSSSGVCLPCQTPARRATSWDLSISSRAVNTPKITNPTDKTVWTIGSDTVATWDTHDVQKGTNPKGTLFLGHLENGSDDEHLDMQRPLASNFLLRQGYVNFTCPNVAEGQRYIVVLVGDSGNRSPEFKIRK